MGTTWGEIFWEASFRGVPFRVRGAEVGGGRRLVRHDFPSSIPPLFEDIGRRFREFTVEGWVVGDDYLDQRDALMAAIEDQSGPGDLVLPWHGALRATCLGYRFTDETAEGRMARCELSFVRAAGEPTTAPRSDTSVRADLDETATAVEDSAAAALEEDLQTTGVLESARIAASDAVKGISATLQSLNVFNGPAQEVAEFTRLVTDLANNAHNLITAPADLAAQVLSSTRQILSLAASIPDALTAYRTLFGFATDDLPGVSAQIVIGNKNAQAVENLAVYAGVSGAARALARHPWESYDQAVAARDLVLADIDTLLEAATDDAFSQLCNLQARVVEAAPFREEDLNRLRDLELNASTPLLALAWDLYQADDRDLELAERNSVPNPLFAAGTLEVLVEPSAA